MPRKRAKGAFPNLETPGGNKDALGLPKMAEERYRELQDEEIMCISAQYGEDFQNEPELSTTWGQIQRVFCVTLRARINSRDEFTATIRVILPPTYPTAKPDMTIEFGSGLHTDYQKKIKQHINNVKARPSDPDAQIVLAAIQSANDELLKAAKDKAEVHKLPSLGEEKLTADAEKQRLEEEKQALEAAKREAEETAKGQRVADIVLKGLKDSIRKESQLAKLNKGNRFGKENAIGEDGGFDFSEQLNIAGKDGVHHLFRAVGNAHKIRDGPIATVFTTRPITKPEAAQLLVVKHYKLKGAKVGDKQDEDKFGIDITELEMTIKEVIDASAGHPNVMRVYAQNLAKVGTDQSNHMSWSLHILMEYGNKGSLEELIEMAGSLNGERTYEWARSICGALAYIHEQDIVHGRLTVSNILLVIKNGIVTPKIADIGFETKLHDIVDNSLSRRNGDDQNPEALLNPAWLAPELHAGHDYSMKTDIWDFGVVVAQMSWGLNVTSRFESPRAIQTREHLHKYLDSFMKAVFATQPKKRPDAKTLELHALLTNYRNAVGLLNEGGSDIRDASERSRRPSLLAQPDHSAKTLTRFEKEYTVLTKLGNGAYGEVLLVQHTHDQHLYAVKKINSTKEANFSEVLSEARLFAQLSHPHIVMYKDCWYETQPINPDDSDEDDDSGSDESSDEDDERTSTRRSWEPSSIPSGTSTVLGSNDINIEFAADSSRPVVSFASGTENAVYSSTHDDTGLRHEEPKVKETFYIAMEYCEGDTLRHAINNNEFLDEPLRITKILRQLLEGLAYMHEESGPRPSLIHRDLKPENVFFRSKNDIKIGDFGLATRGYKRSSKRAGRYQQAMSQGIGTANYIAPEVLTDTRYTTKADLYSLGIILFEMCYPAMRTGTERGLVLGKLRDQQPVFPSDFDREKFAKFVPIIEQLLRHNPDDRPSASQLISSGILPDSATIRMIEDVIHTLKDPESDHYKPVVDALFEKQRHDVSHRDGLDWGLHNKDTFKPQEAVYSLSRMALRKELTAIFRRHGAVDTPRPILFPHTSFYDADAPELLHLTGIPLQLCNDLTLPLARALAFANPLQTNLYSYELGCSYQQGNEDGKRYLIEPQPEAVFDIISDNQNLLLKEAEVIRVLDEIISAVPCLPHDKMVFNINHSNLLSVIFDYCKVDHAHRRDAVAVLADWDVELWKWSDIKAKLRRKDISTASISLLEKFTFRSPLTEAMKTLSIYLEEDGHYARALDAIEHMAEVIKLVNLLGVKSRVLIAPLGCTREEFCKGSLTFSCQDETDNSIIAAGGRYDSLIEKFVNPLTKNKRLHGVGFNLDWDKLTENMVIHLETAMKRSQKSSKVAAIPLRAQVSALWTSKRCDVLVCSNDRQILHNECISLLKELWDANISAELSEVVGDPSTHYRNDSHYWYVFLGKKTASIRTVGQGVIRDGDAAPKTDDFNTTRLKDIKPDNVVATIKTLIRERSGNEDGEQYLPQATLEISKNPKQEVIFIHNDNKPRKGSTTKSRKETSVQNAVLISILDDLEKSTAYSVDWQSNKTLYDIACTPLSDIEGWNRLRANCLEKKELDIIHNHLKTQQHLYQKVGEKSKLAFLVNSRTNVVVPYVLGL